MQPAAVWSVYVQSAAAGATSAASTGACVVCVCVGAAHVECIKFWWMFCLRQRLTGERGVGCVAYHIHLLPASLPALCGHACARNRVHQRFWLHMWHTSSPPAQSLSPPDSTTATSCYMAIECVLYWTFSGNRLTDADADPDSDTDPDLI